MTRKKRKKKKKRRKGKPKTANEIKPIINCYDEFTC